MIFTCSFKASFSNLKLSMVLNFSVKIWFCDLMSTTYWTVFSSIPPLLYDKMEIYILSNSTVVFESYFMLILTLFSLILLLLLLLLVILNMSPLQSGITLDSSPIHLFILSLRRRSTKRNRKFLIFIYILVLNFLLIQILESINNHDFKY